MVFEPKRAEIFKVVKQERYFFRFVRPLKILFFCFFVFLFFYWLFWDFEILGACFLSLGLAIFFWLQELFFDSKLRFPQIKDKTNLAEVLSFEAAKAVFLAERFAQAKNIAQVNSTLLFFALLQERANIIFIFSRANLDFDQIKKRLEEQIENLKRGEFEGYSSDFLETVAEASKIAERKEHPRIEIGDVILALVKQEPCFKQILIDFDLQESDVENLIFWQESLEKTIEQRKRFWEWQNLVRLGSVAREWTAGYTITLDQFSIDITELLKKQGFIELIGHDEEIEKAERVLARSQTNNLLFVGQAGTGRKTILQALAQKSLFGQSLEALNYKRMKELNIPSLLAQIEEPGQREAVLDRIFQEVIRAGNIILVIDEIHNYVGGLARPGAIDISGLLAKYLTWPEFRLIGITTYQGLHQYIEQNPSFEALFEKVEVSEISADQTILVLENLTFFYERKYKRFIGYPAIRDIVELSDRYLPSLSWPKKAIDILDEAMVYLSTSTRDRVLLPRHVAKIVSEKTQIPVGEMLEKEKEVLLNLEALIHKRIINQDRAVQEVARAMRRARAEISVRKRPIGCFLFLGPTGCGKTETSKALAEIYFGSEERMIRLDMSEFQTVEDIKRIIGAPGQEGLLTTPVRENPFSLILLDEIEKAHFKILHLFLQVFDEGHVTDGLGRKVSFKNSIIICTSNAGYKVILKALKENLDWEKLRGQLLDYLFEKAIFRPEFINRFDAVVVFRSLTKENLLLIAGLMLEKLKKNLALKHIELEITEPLKEKIVELGYSPIFGAREMQRVIQDKVEDVLARALLKGELKRGDKIKITEDFKIVKQS